MASIRVSTRALVVLALLAAPACYTYSPGSVESITPGEEVRVRVTREAAARLEPALASQETTLEGQVVRAENGSLWLDVISASRHIGFHVERMSQTVNLEDAETLTVEIKTLDRPRTFVAVGVVALVSGAIAWKALSGESGGNTSQGPGGQPSDDRIVRFFPSIRLPIRPF
jgi:hypothetical protein